MAVSYVASSSSYAVSSTTNLDIVAPACQRDDILIAMVINKALTIAIVKPDATWTQIYQANGDCTTAADDHRAAIFWKRATVSDSGATFRFTKASGTVQFAGAISAFRGCHASATPMDSTAVGATVTAGANDNVAFPAFDPTDTDNMTVFVAFYGNDTTTFAAAMSNDTNPDCTVQFDFESATGNDSSMAMCCGTNDGSNIAARTWASASGTDAGSTGVVFALDGGDAGSASNSPSNSPSTSPSGSPSNSPSTSPSGSPSNSPSGSPSNSPSSSPSPGWEGYSRGAYAALPTNANNLTTAYSAQDYLDVDTDNAVRVAQTATSQYAIHEFKDYAGTSNYASFYWDGQSDLAPSTAIVKLQIWNVTLSQWDDIDDDNTTGVNTDFVLQGSKVLTDYKDASTVVTCRVYQLAP
jgi:hypothetical protein